MRGSLSDSWKHTWAAIWGRMDASTKKPADLFVRLFHVASPLIVNRPDPQTQINILNDTAVAKEFLKGLASTDFGSESSLIGFLEKTYVELNKVSADFAAFYKAKVSLFIIDYNIQYRLKDPFTLVVRQTHLMSTLYEELLAINGTNQGLASNLDDFEHCMHQYYLHNRNVDLRSALIHLTNYQESLSKATLGTPNSTDTLGTLIRGLKTWPHPTLRVALGAVYGFCSNYPNTRHGGNPASSSRSLNSIDAVSLCTIMLAFCGYLTDSIDATTLIET